jgi:hypothetical protein
VVDLFSEDGLSGQRYGTCLLFVGAAGKGMSVRRRRLPGITKTYCDCKRLEERICDLIILSLPFLVALVWRLILLSAVFDRRCSLLVCSNRIGVH